MEILEENYFLYKNHLQLFFIDDAIEHAIINPIVISPSHSFYDAVILLDK